MKRGFLAGYSAERRSMILILPSINFCCRLTRSNFEGTDSGGSGVVVGVVIIVVAEVLCAAAQSRHMKSYAYTPQ